MGSDAITSVRSCLRGEWSVNSEPESANRELKKKVGFGQVEIRTHHVVLSDNPACKDGCPMELGWDHVDTCNFDLEEFEAKFADEIHRSLKRISWHTRQQWLLENGHTHGSFARIRQDIDQIKASRKQTEREVKRAKQDRPCQQSATMKDYQQLIRRLSVRLSEMDCEDLNDEIPKQPARRTSKQIACEQAPKMPVRRVSVQKVPSKEAKCRKPLFSRLKRN